MINKSIFREYVKSVRKSELLHSFSFGTVADMPKASCEGGGCHD